VVGVRLGRCRQWHWAWIPFVLLFTILLYYQPNKLFTSHIYTILFFTVILATDQINARSILMYQRNLDKIAELSSHSAMGVSGPNCDLVNFSEYISKNLKLYELSNDGMKLSTHAQANFCRGELAKALRKGPFQVNVVLGGYDAKTPTGGSLYVMDYLGSCVKANFGVQGYASKFCLSIMDRDWEEGMNEEQAVNLVEHCIKELQLRFLINQSNFIVKVIDKEGVRTLKFGADPADN
jgi:20S proteasome subunit beta 4